MNSVQKSNNHLASCYLEQPVNIFPAEIWLNIFSNMSSKDVAACMLCCSELRDLGAAFWRGMFVQKFGPIKETILAEGADERSWRINYQLGELIPFFQKVSELSAPKCIKNKDYTFIRHRKKIVVRHGDKEFILTGDKSQRFSHIVVSGDFLFALCKNGEIVQWDYKNSIVVRTIETEFSRNQFPGKKVVRNADAFIVEKDSIFIKYHSLPLCEIISYSTQEVSSTVFHIPSKLKETRILKEDKKVYFLENNKIKIYDLSLPEEMQEYLFSEPLGEKVAERDGCIFKKSNMLFVATSSNYELMSVNSRDKYYVPDKRITLLDADMKPRYFYCQRFPRAMTIVNNSLITAHLVIDTKSTNIGIEIFDLRSCVTSPFLAYETKEFARQIKPGIIISDVIDSQTGNIDPAAIKSLFQVIDEQSISVKQNKCVVM